MTVKLEQTLTVGKGLPTIRTALRATLVREDAGEAPLVDGPDLRLEPLVSHVDRAAVQKNQAERLVAGAPAEKLLDDARPPRTSTRRRPAPTGRARRPCGASRRWPTSTPPSPRRSPTPSGAIPGTRSS